MKNNDKKDLLSEITELQERLKNLEPSEGKRILALVKSMARFSDENPNPVLRISEYGRIIYANQASAPLLKRYRCEVGQTLPEPMLGPALDSFARGLKNEIEVECGEVIFSLDIEPVTDSGYVDIYGQDITERKRLESEGERLNKEAETSLEWMLGRSGKMREVIEQIRRIAKTDFTVILQGETGVGKSFIASIIHNLSPRAHNPFIRIDLGTIPETLLESELFGYEKGAFTGADRKRKGLFELAAHGGTIFIDELENMTPYAQSKFLTVIEEKKIHPLGSSDTKQIDVRIISATNKDIKQALAEKKIRKDLFYRLSEFVITIPPLRERVDDIPFLAQKFLIEAEAKLKIPVKNFSEEIFDVLKRYPWPGNVRELRNIIIRRAVLLSQDRSIKRGDIEFLLEDTSGNAESSEQLPLKELTATAVRDVEKKAIKKALESTKGNKSKAALLLDINYKTLLIKIKEYNLS
ncbi:MAG: sigma 54-interacting transcriptional regulator [Dissulfurispiraceae bacterium]|jgi:transcriptional regulator with PAS, ATPase and Fis domain